MFYELESMINELDLVLIRAKVIQSDRGKMKVLGSILDLKIVGIWRSAVSVRCKVLKDDFWSFVVGVRHFDLLSRGCLRSPRI